MAHYEKMDNCICSLDFTGHASVNFEAAFGWMDENEDYVDNYKWLNSLNSDFADRYVEILLMDAEKIKLEIGAAELYVDSLISNRFVAKMGAGELEIKKLVVSNFAQIASGAGEIAIEDGEIHNLNMSLGAGEVDICAAITGDSQISAGVGELVLKLLGSPEDYSATITKGIGSCSVNGFTCCNGNTYGDGPNRLKVSGGVGSLSVVF